MAAQLTAVPLRRLLTRALVPLRRRARQDVRVTSHLAARFDEQLLAAADAAVSLARRALYDVTWPQLPPHERLAARGEVTIEDVADMMQLLHGITVIPRESIAVALRRAYEARSGRIDLTTDAYTL